MTHVTRRLTARTGISSGPYARQSSIAYLLTFIAVCSKPHRYGNSRAILDHTVLYLPGCYSTEVIFPPLPYPMLVLDLVTPEGCKAEST